MGPQSLRLAPLIAAVVLSACGTGGGTPGSPPTTTTTLAPVATVALPDPLDAFFEDFQAAVQTANVAWLLEHLHPAVIDLYGLEQCADDLRGVIPQVVEILPTAVGEKGPWVMEFDATPVQVPDTYEVAVVFHEGATRREATVHFGDRFGKLHWFTDCGEPLEVPGGPSG